MHELTEADIDSALELLLRLGLVRDRGGGVYELTPNGKKLAELLHDPTVRPFLSQKERLTVAPPAI